MSTSGAHVGWMMLVILAIAGCTERGGIRGDASEPTCDGCLSNGVCMVGTERAACGRSGDVCTACYDWELCRPGCSVDPESRWKITAVSFALDSSKEFDPGVPGVTNPPDPFATLTVNSTVVTRTPTVQDAYSGSWNTVLAADIRGDVLFPRPPAALDYEIAFWDEDQNFNDMIGTLQFGAQSFGPGDHTATAGPNNTFLLHLVWLNDPAAVVE